MKPTLEHEVARFRHMYPNSSVRFAEVIGRRVSHLAGPLDELHVAESRVAVNGRLVMFVSNGDAIPDEDIERFAVQVAAILEGTSDPPCRPGTP